MYGNSAAAMNHFSFIKILLFPLIFLMVLIAASAHSDEAVSEHQEGDEHSDEEHAEESVSAGLEESVKLSTLKVVAYALSVIAILILMATFGTKTMKNSNSIKMVLFSLIVLVTVSAAAYTAGSTIYLNLASQTKGPVHWHADFEIYNCGEKLDLTDPHGFENRVGSSTFHEHGDNRIHVEGVVVDDGDVALHNFFHVIGAELNADSMSIPTNEGLVEMANGDLCDGKQGKLQVFLYKVKNPDQRKKWVYEQIKPDDFENYVLSPEPNVPPGDCIIVEFGEEKDSTENICETYRLAAARGELSGS
ncbi:hypothetical protein HYX10_04950 [Candidatus Woesearchaeota archaeon]|nr:hypothetical protein [Candidatus Woesearchaeota archaeon]